MTIQDIIERDYRESVLRDMEIEEQKARKARCMLIVQLVLWIVFLVIVGILVWRVCTSEERLMSAYLEGKSGLNDIYLRDR